MSFPTTTTLHDKALWALSQVGRTSKDSFTIIIENAPSAWNNFIAYVNNHRTEFGIACALITAGVLIIVIPLAIGFGPAGPILKSMAAAWQSSIGSVLAGSLFSTLQSLGMTGFFTTAGEGLMSAGVALPLTMWALRWCTDESQGQRVDLWAEGMKRMGKMYGFEWPEELTKMGKMYGLECLQAAGRFRSML